MDIHIKAVFDTWHHKCASQKEQNDTLSCNCIAIATLSAPVSLCHKKQMSPIAAFKMRERVLLGTNIVPILSYSNHRIQKLGISVFIETAPAAKLLSC